MRRVVIAAALIGLTPVTALAQPKPADSARADSLFKSGRKKMAEKKIDEACADFAESQRIDPSGGTLLNLAVCHDAQGKSVTAAAELVQVIQLAKDAKNADALKLAEEALAKAKSNRSSLTIAPDEGALRRAKLAVSLDGKAFDPAMYGKRIAVDAGHHVVVADDAAGAHAKVEIDVGKNGDRQTVVVSFPNTPVVADTHDEPAPIPAASSKPSRAPAFIAFGAGAVGLGVGIVSGVIASSSWNDAKAVCPDRVCPSAEGLSKYDSAKTAAIISDIGIGAAVVGVGVGTILLLTSRSTGSSVRVEARSNGVSLAGQW